MTFSLVQLIDIKNRIDATRRAGRLNAWQSRFLSDVETRIARYGENTRLSAKQLQKLHEIIGLPTRGAIPQRVLPDTAVRSRSRRGGWLARQARWFSMRMVRDFALAGALIAGFAIYSLIQKPPELMTDFPSIHSNAPDRSAPRFSVTDGDTVRVAGERTGTRLVGFNTPETTSPRCDRELQLGRKATARLKQLVSSGDATLRKVACACAPGTEGTKACNHGRSCGILRVDGRDVGQILIAEGLAVPFQCGTTSCPPIPRPWCS